MWRVRDQLNAVLSSAGLRQLLEANKQYVPSGESKVRGRERQKELQ